MKHHLITMILLSAVCLLCACSHGSDNSGSTSSADDIIILFDGDTHGTFGGYVKMAALKRQMLQKTPYVLLCSTGDFLQGSPLCAISRGKSMVDLVNAAGYDYITPGSHDFDFGYDRLRELADSIDAQVLLCNLQDADTRQPVFMPCTVRDCGDRKVGLIGVVNPATQTNNAPQSYLNADGSQRLTFCQETFYKLVQKCVDDVRAQGADYVVVLSHMGNSRGTDETAREMIRRTSGIDAVLDSHDHKTVPEDHVLNAKGEQVVLTSTGARFQYMGALMIQGNGKVTVRMIPTQQYSDTDDKVQAIADERQRELDDSPAIGHVNFVLQGYDKQGHYNRNVQTNLASLYADAIRGITGAEVGWINAAAISASINKGDIKLTNLLEVCPYGNMICVAEVSGQQLMDALEYCTHRMPQDFGNYPVVSGLLYSLDTLSTSSVKVDEMGFMSGYTNSHRRVSHVTVYSRSASAFQAIDPQRKYRVASVDYILKNHGCGNVFAGCPIIQDEDLLDVLAIQRYIEYMPNCVVSESYNYQK